MLYVNVHNLDTESRQAFIAVCEWMDDRSHQAMPHTAGYQNKIVVVPSPGRHNNCGSPMKDKRCHPDQECSNTFDSYTKYAFQE